MQALFARFDVTLKAAGWLAMGGQIVDATIVAAPKQRNTEVERPAIKAGQVPEGWTNKPAKLRQKDRDARWAVQFSKAKPREDGLPQVDLTVPTFGYKNHIGIDRGHGLIRGWTAPGWRTCSTPTTPPATSGPTPRIARPGTRQCWLGAA